MSLSIFLAHTGGYLQADARTFASVEELRKWIEQKSRLPPSCQIIMTTRGTNVKTNTLSNERELFLYDRKKLELSSKAPADAIPRIQTPAPFPDDIDSETEMSSWRLLFKKRKSWADSVLVHAKTLAPLILEADAAAKVMRRAVVVAFSNLESHSVGLQGSLGKLREWAEGVMEDRDRILNSWEPAVKRLVRIPVHEEFRSFGVENGEKKIKVLADFFDVKEVQKAAAAAAMLAERFEKDVTELGVTIEDIASKTGQLRENIQRANSAAPNGTEDRLNVLLGDIDMLVKKVATDYDYVRGLQGPKAASIASKRAYASTTEYLPGLISIINDVGRLLQAAVKEKNETSVVCLEQLQSLGVIQSLAAPVNHQINELDAAFQEEDNNFNLLSLVLRLPSAYGSLLVECIRRKEWSERFSGNSQRLAEELAQIREDEEKRRRKWQRNTGSILPFEIGDSSQIVRVELNMRGDPNGGMPKIAREDLESFIATIKQISGMDTVVKEVTQALQDLEKPSRRLNKRLKGFKMGSVHEANLMNSSFFGRNDDELKLLRADKETLSERIKGYESRIRKLEDLLHRGRTSSGNVYQAGTTTPQPPTPVQQTFSSNSQGTMPSSEQPNAQAPGISRRGSSDNTAEVKLTARIASLEADLAAEKELSAQLKKETVEKTESEKEMTVRITHADDTKRDLVANLEQTVQQHVSERKALQREIDDLKHKLDEAYDAIERMEDERVRELEGELGEMSAELDRWKELFGKEEENAKALEEQMAAFRREKEEESAALRGQLDFLSKRVDEETQRASEAEAALSTSEQTTVRLVDTIKSLEKQLQEARDIVNSCRVQEVSQRQSQDSMVSAMKQTHGILSGGQPPEDLTALMDEMEALVQKAVSRNKDLSLRLDVEHQRVLSLEENQSRLQSRFDSRTIKAKDLTQRLYTHNARSIQLLEALGFRIVRGEDSMQIVRVSRSSGNNESTILARSTNVGTSPEATPSHQTRSPLSIAQSSTAEDINLLYWMEASDSEVESEKYTKYLSTIGALDFDAVSEAIVNRVKKADDNFRHVTKQGRSYREKYYRAREEASEKIAFKSFKPGDLALFLPTRNQPRRPWAAFNSGAPHFFLREQDAHGLARKDFLLARITKVEERLVDLSRSTTSSARPERAASSDSTGGLSYFDEENPFELSDGLRWYLVDAVEEKPGAPSTPGLSASTVSTATVDAKGSMRARKPVSGAKKKLSEITTEHSRRSSNSSRNSVALPSDAAAAVAAAIHGPAGESAIVDSPEAPRTPVTGAEKMESRTSMERGERVG